MTSYSLRSVHARDYADSDDWLDDDEPRPRAAYRLPPPPSALHGRVAAAAVTLGAVAAAITAQVLPWHHPAAEAADNSRLAANIVTLSNDDLSLDVQPASRVADAGAEAQQLAESQRFASLGGSAGFVKPTAGTVIASFGGRYGTFHYGIDIASGKDTPIVASADGVIVAAGPASGFGLWVKEQLTDGTTLVYARMDDYSVQVGQHVQAGQQIARMGNGGFGATYTLHFEVWDPTGKKIDPEQWLNARGIIL